MNKYKNKLDRIKREAPKSSARRSKYEQKDTTQMPRCFQFSINPHKISDFSDKM